MAPKAHVLVVDDHPQMAKLLRDQLADSGYAVQVAGSGAAAIEAIQKGLFDVVLCDLRMEEVDGFDVLAAARAADPGLPVLMMTAFGGIDSAVEAIKRGAFHYFSKPFRLDEVLVYLDKALSERRLREENRAFRKVTTAASTFVSKSRAMKSLQGLLERAGASHTPVLIRGESGVGKELVARALHALSPRSQNPLVSVNCTAMPATLLESELFGHVRGAFTGAVTQRRGLLVAAEGGTLFLDEIGDMAPDLQAKLLRVLELGEVRPVGSDQARRVDVRVIAATHQNLDQRVQEGAFREDLFYRLNVIPLRVPPLRERAEDIPELAQEFVREARARNPGARVQGFGEEAVHLLKEAPWKGNVRELRNLVERLVVLLDQEVVDANVLRPHLFPVVVPPLPASMQTRGMVPLREAETAYIAWVIDQCGGNKTRAAEILGIDVSTIHRRGRDGR